MLMSAAVSMVTGVLVDDRARAAGTREETNSRPEREADRADVCQSVWRFSSFFSHLVQE